MACGDRYSSDSLIINWDNDNAAVRDLLSLESSTDGVHFDKRDDAALCYTIVFFDFGVPILCVALTLAPSKSNDSLDIDLGTDDLARVGRLSYRFLRW